MLGARARLRAHRRRLPVPAAVRLRPGLERGARARQGVHAGDAVLRAARRRRARNGWLARARWHAGRPGARAPHAARPAGGARRGAR